MAVWSNRKLWLVIFLLAAAALGGAIYFLILNKLSNAPENGQESSARPCLTGSKTIGIPDPNGPSYHHVYLATSKDGLDWQTANKMIIEQASVPELARLNDGTLFIYAVDGSGLGGPGLVYAKSQDNGETWECGKVSDVSLGADPDVVVLPDGTIRLYYIEFPFEPGGVPTGPTKSEKPNAVKSATSLDNINFKDEQGTRLEGVAYTDPDVLLIGNEWFMYISAGPTAWAAKSSDGLEFKLVGQVNQSGAVSGSYVFPDGTIRHYFCGSKGIEIATSATGDSAWTRVGTAVATDSATQKIVCDPSVVSDGEGGYLMVYKVQPK